MHPDPAFAWNDEAAMRGFVAAVGFAQISAAVDGRPMIAHAPLGWAADGSAQFHLARRNPLAARLDGATAIACVLGEHFYVSPDWYGMAEQVPTWNYRLVEIEGVARALDAAELAAQADAVSAAFERQLAPKRPWTSGKLAPARREALLTGIVGFAIEAPRLRGTAKLGQNKPPHARAGVADALRALGQDAAAAAMERTP